jgi:hypothetical protein
LHADRERRHRRGGAGEERAEALEELRPVDRAAPHLVVHVDHAREGRRLRQGLEDAVLAPAVHVLRQLARRPLVADRVHAAEAGAGADGDEDLRLLADLLDLLDVLGAHQRPLDERDVVVVAPVVDRLAEVHDLDHGHEVEEHVLRREDLQLAPLARAEGEEGRLGARRLRRTGGPGHTASFRCRTSR